MRQLSESRINKNSAYHVVRVDNSVVRFRQGTIGNNSYFAAAIVAKKNPDYEEIINAFSFFKIELKAKFPDAEID